MAIWVAIILGGIQGVFMFFPVSSTSHLVLAQHAFRWSGQDIPSPESPEMILFDLVVHVGTLVSIGVVFRRSLVKFILKTFGELSALFREGVQKKEFLFLKLTALGAFSVIVTGLIGFPLKSHFESVFEHPFLISITLTITGVLLWWTDTLPRRRIGLRQIGLAAALVIGAGQGLALLPGLSRSGLTIAFALLAGVKRRWAAEYSFFIAFPTILGATLLQGLEVAVSEEPFQIGLISLTVGFIVAAIVGVGALYLVVHLLYRAKFRFFSYYVWGLAVAILISYLLR